MESTYVIGLIGASFDTDFFSSLSPTKGYRDCHNMCKEFILASCGAIHHLHLFSEQIENFIRLIMLSCGDRKPESR